MVVRRFGIGFSSSGSLVGTPTAITNAVICDPSNAVNPVAEYRITGSSVADLTLHNTSGTTAMSMTRTSAGIVMTWSRAADNGDANDAQIANEALGNIVWLVGSSPSLSAGGSTSGFESAVVSAVGLPRQASCRNIAIDSRLSLSWEVKGSLVHYSAVLRGRKAW